MSPIQRFSLLFASIFASVQAQTYSTFFSTTENPISESGKWTNGGTVGLDWQNVRTTAGTPNKAYGTGVSYGYNDCIALLSGFPANQSAEATVYREPGYTPPSSHEIELLLRFQVSAHYARGYEMDFWYGGEALQMVRWNGPIGDFTVLNNSGPGPQGLVTGDVVKAQMIGNTITVFKNGNVISTYVDNTFQDGNPGMGFFIRPGGSPDKYCYTRFSASASGSTTDSSGSQGGSTPPPPAPDSAPTPHRHPRRTVRLVDPASVDGQIFDITGRSYNAGATAP